MVREIRVGGPKDPTFADVDITDKFTYDGDLCYRLWIDYLADAITDDQFMTYLRKYAILRVRKLYYRKLGPDICEDLVQSALLELWKLVAGRKLPQDGVGVFHSFLNTVIRRRIAKAFKDVYDDAPYIVDARKMAKNFYRKVSCAERVEATIFLEEVPDLLRKRILPHLPFQDLLRRQACAYILDCLLQRHRIVVATLRKVYRVRDPDFLIEHVKISMRHHLYDLKKDVTLPTNSEKREILDAGIEECFGF